MTALCGAVDNWERLLILVLIIQKRAGLLSLLDRLARVLHFVYRSLAYRTRISFHNQRIVS